MTAPDLAPLLTMTEEQHNSYRDLRYEDDVTVYSMSERGLRLECVRQVFAELDAQRRARFASTCATCRFWCEGPNEGESMRAAYIENAPTWQASCGKAHDFKAQFINLYVHGDGYVQDFEMDTPATFGCNFHEVRADLRKDPR